MIYPILFLIFILATGVLIATIIDFYQEVGGCVIHDTRKSIKNWYRGTRLFMWSNNRKNKVKVLSEKEYLNLLAEGKIKYVVIEEEG